MTLDSETARGAAGNAACAITFRPGAREDARVIAGLFRISSDGIADYIWTKLAEPGEDLLDVGERRYARTGVPFSFENCEIAESGGAVLGMLHGFPMPPREPGEVEEDPVLRPYAELELPGSYYISGVAVEDHARGRGVGTALIERAADRARAAGLKGLSLIVFERNVGAKRLYDRLGFRVVDTRLATPHPLIHYTGAALLMARE